MYTIRESLDAFKIAAILTYGYTQGRDISNVERYCEDAGNTFQEMINNMPIPVIERNYYDLNTVYKKLNAIDSIMLDLAGYFEDEYTYDEDSGLYKTRFDLYEDESDHYIEKGAQAISDLLEDCFNLLIVIERKEKRG